MTLAAVRRLLDARVGLDPDTLGPTVFPSAVADRCRATGVAVAEYADRLTRDPAEFDALLAKLVVPETWFFRGNVFAALAARAAATRAAHPGRPFRALSVPCSTGEEPYSLAIALLDAGLGAAGAWAIDAVDVSPAAVAVARRGVYRDLSFRQTPPGCRDRHFRETPDGWELDAALRGRVRFRVGNVLEPAAFAADAGAFDLILCRNLLIYLTADGRRRVVDLLETLLAPGGWLAVGHAEPGVLDGRGFAPVGPDAGFVFAKGGPERPRGTERVEVPAPRIVEPFRPAPAVATVPDPTPTPAPAPVPEPPLSAARRLADSGRLADALSATDSALAADPTADGFALLAVVRQARGDHDGAADALRKALYLDPNHRDALTLAELVARARGRTAEADAFRARLGKLSGGPP